MFGRNSDEFLNSVEMSKKAEFSFQTLLGEYDIHLHTGQYRYYPKKSDKVATQLKARGDLIGLGFDWFNFIRDWFRFSIG